MPKKELKGNYAAFINSPGGQDFLKQAEILEKSFILQAIKATTNDEKASSISKLEGMVTLRDYLIRMSKD